MPRATTRRRPMQVSIEMIVEAAGKLPTFKEAIRTRSPWHLRLENEPYMPLVIDVTGEGFVSVAHYGTQNGDAMRDPEIVFNPQTWYAVEITQDYLGRFQRLRPNTYSPGIEELARVWARNLREQGFVEAANQWRLEQFRQRQAQPEPAPEPQPAPSRPKKKDKRQINAMLEELSRELGFNLPDGDEAMKGLRNICRKYMTAKKPVSA